MHKELIVPIPWLFLLKAPSLALHAIVGLEIMGTDRETAFPSAGVLREFSETWQYWL
jgi:hypothetical protein